MGIHEKKIAWPRSVGRCVLASGWWLGLFLGVAGSLPAQPALGDAPQAPRDVSGLPREVARPRVVTEGLNVDPSSREQTREFYNAVYSASAGVPMDSTAVTADCFPGTNAPAFGSATLLRINWFRAMAGLPAGVIFDADESTDDQAAAVMMSVTRPFMVIPRAARAVPRAGSGCGPGRVRQG